MSTVLSDPAAEPLPCAAKPPSEALRLQALRSYGILDTPREAAFEDITRLASIICQTPIALISLVDAERQWFKSERGMGERETPLFKSMCAHALLDSDVLVVPDTREDVRFARNPLVTGEAPLHFYAGAVLKTSEGLPLGTVCVLDRQPRQLSAEQVDALRALARQTMAQLELRRALQVAEESDRYRSRLMAIAGHDLKTPLRTAAYAIDKMRRHANVDSVPTLVTARDAINLVARNLDELATLAAASETATPDLQPLALEDVLHSVLGVWRQPAIDKCLALRHVPTSLRVRSHPTLLTTLLGNLIGNAVKYTERGRVLVGVRRRPGHAVVEIIDSGIGLNLDHPEQVFQAFRQADPRSDGLGIGLWIVHRTAETLGCEVDVRPRPGGGTCFSVRIPLA
ncbi:GAF domain-containing sensor histidine kinase [Xanthomonas sp. NCPPB 2865]|jgi:signal transduction histidine kinase|uniref:histidine kinase n=1 Tax=Xanthomonas arboricola TaxID=56448 RepID=A0AB73GXJ1_9XANT|nr:MULTISPECIES: GAF domain-containing sensor histidine kinase [Xanthomonas]MBB3759922.1 signal transduction histidine kinase [Xanthomonas arboricola]MBB4604800.1 signal transduction histidine kinase [Xanthomonas arboricola]MBB4706724.1 signal transduction histidine kinase [Xanthomonas arboricola]MBB4770150.1 signal transduction histidine kinase [Xanthomonas arboricola]MBB5670316.1 signal transduction histidine kinase [Xanthomonas arboricola]